MRSFPSKAKGAERADASPETTSRPDTGTIGPSRAVVDSSSSATPWPSAPSTVQVASWAGPKKPAKKRPVRGVGDDAFLALLEDVQGMIERGEVDGFQPRHFVALYADLYFRVYGVAPIDLGSKERVFAAKLAADLLGGDFGGKASELADFVSWTWTREKGREKWRRENPERGGSRISWRVQFGRSLLADYRVDKARAAARKERR